MTREEYIDWLFRLRAELNNGVIFTPWNKEFTEALTGILEQERDCKTCIHSDKGNCAGTEECHECMWESKYEQEPCEDEYIKVPKKALKYRTAGMVAYNVEWLKKHFDIERVVICGAQEPCIDAISRQGVIDAMIKRFDGENAHDQFWNCDMVMDILRDMPSVKPQEKTDVLDKIRAEIKEHVGINQNLNIERAKALCWCLDVIDKYAGAKEETCDLYDECNKECPLYMFCHQQESEEQA